MKIAIWGLGVSGLGALKYLTSENKHEIFAINQGDVASWYQEQSLEKMISKDHCYSQSDLKSLEGKLDLIILSPGIDPKIKALRPFANTKKICDIEYVSKYIKRPIIAVTGTNGKTSTVTMIYDALELAEKSVFLGGNIGTSPFEALDDIDKYDYFVFELSSFQLELMDEFAPKIAVILNVSPTHMERYESYEEYVLAKVNITKSQKSDDYLLLNQDLMELDTKASKVAIEALSEFDFANSKLLGEHMKHNFYVVYKVLDILKIEKLDEVMQEFINSFSGVKYRLQYIGTLRGVDFYNDAKSTNTASTIAALNSFGTKNVALILGGKLRDLTQDFMPGLKKSEANISLFLFGESREFLREQLEDSFRICVQEKLDDLIDDIIFSEYDVVLFSPGFPSFDQYKNYLERGEHFNQLVEKLF